MDLKNTVAFIKPFVSGSIGAAIFILIYHACHITTPKMGSVNIHSLVNEHIEKNAMSPLSENELLLDSRQFVEKLERCVANLAKSEHLYLIISDAVISGTQDYTDNIRRSLEGSR